MTFLLDVNVLIALIDPRHASHERAHAWFAREGSASWATCPITENGVIRIVGHRNYPNSPGSPAGAAKLVQELCELPGHVFWPEDISLLDDAHFAREALLTSAQVTATYLLGLTARHGGMLATLDQRLATGAALAGRRALHLITSPQDA